MSATDKHAIQLLTGRSIRLVRLDQHWTYGGLLAGHPSHEMNRRIMDGLVTRNSGRGGDHVPVLLEPLQTPLEKTSDPSWASAAALPAAACVAQFQSKALADDDLGFASVLTVIWFQDDFAFPVDPGILLELRALDWETRAWSWQP